MTDATTIDALAYLYIAFGHAPDEILTPEEMRTLSQRLQAWTPDEDLEPIGDALKRAVATYKSIEAPRDRLARALEQAQILAGAVSPDKLPRILEDLESIAQADGTVTREEDSFIEAIRKVLGVG